MAHSAGVVLGESGDQVVGDAGVVVVAVEAFQDVDVFHSASIALENHATQGLVGVRWSCRVRNV